MTSDEIILLRAVDPNNASTTLNYYGSDVLWQLFNDMWLVDFLIVSLFVFFVVLIFGFLLVRK